MSGFDSSAVYAVMNVNGFEAMIILLVALVVLGPERLPEAARKAGSFINQMRRMSDSFQQEIRDAVDVPDLDMDLDSLMKPKSAVMKSVMAPPTSVAASRTAAQAERKADSSEPDSTDSDSNSTDSAEPDSADGQAADTGTAVEDEVADTLDDDVEAATEAASSVDDGA